MPECSLCGGSLAPEGGTVLFADYRGIPFEVCADCTDRIDRLHGDAEEDRALALEYISGHADNIENRGVYAELIRFIEGETVEPAPVEETGAPESREIPEEPSEVPEEPAKTGKGRGIFWAAVGAVLAVVLVIIYILGGIRF